MAKVVARTCSLDVRGLWPETLSCWNALAIQTYPDWFVKAWRAGAGNSFAVNLAWMVHLSQLGIMRSSRLCIGGTKVGRDWAKGTKVWPDVIQRDILSKHGEHGESRSCLEDSDWPRKWEAWVHSWPRKKWLIPDFQAIYRCRMWWASTSFFSIW